MDTPGTASSVTVAAPTCARSFVEDPGSASYEPSRKEEILRAYHEHASLRGVSRIFGVSRNTLT
ncbi:MAG: hypothetical protein M3122_06845, partial [Actinomycetota bacterium]|nr:hypothetical protein [Actinomycetota bacterium]